MNYSNYNPYIYYPSLYLLSLPIATITPIATIPPYSYYPSL